MKFVIFLALSLVVIVFAQDADVLPSSYTSPPFNQASAERLKQRIGTDLTNLKAQIQSKIDSPETPADKLAGLKALKDDLVVLQNILLAIDPKTATIQNLLKDLQSARKQLTTFGQQFRSL